MPALSLTVCQLNGGANKLDKPPSRSKFDELRLQAEELLKGRGRQPSEFSGMDILSLIHELEVGQIELQIQNEELRSARRELEQSRNRYENLFQYAPVGYVDLAPDGSIAQSNIAAKNILGITVQHRFYYSFSSLICPVDQGKFWDVMNRAAKGERSHEACELRIVTPAGLRDIQMETAPSLDTEGKLMGWRIALVDITDRKHAESKRQELEAQLFQAQKMESVGRLAGGVAHDFNNMLGVIIGHAEMALQVVDSAQSAYFNLKEILAAANRSADMVMQLLAFARKQMVSPQVLDINETVESLLKMIHRIIGNDIDLEWSLGSDLWPVKIDPAQIEQILANLCVNARDAIAGRGKVSIETKKISIDEDSCDEHPGASPSRYVLLSVSDDGCGMEAEVLSRLFEPFFTTKEVGKGTGLGLATVYGIVKQNNGYINAESEPGRGTKFFIYLPGADVPEPEDHP